MVSAFSSQLACTEYRAGTRGHSDQPMNTVWRQADGGATRFIASSSGATMSIGSGKTMVEFLSAAITVSVSR